MPAIRKEDLLIIIQILANMFRMFGVILFIPLLASIFYAETEFTLIFASMAVVIILVSTIIRYFLKINKCDFKHAILSLAIGWASISAVSAIPFLLYPDFGFVNSFFESLSGWTGSGLTMVQHPSLLPHTLNLFRAMMQWIGGFGIVILALLLYEKPKTAQTLFLAEGRFEDFYVDILKVARMIVVIYLIYTLFGTLMLNIAGVPFFDAFIHSLTTISTGGFSTNEVGIGMYGGVPMFIGIALMYLGGISFLSHYALIKGKVKKFFKNPELRYLFILSFISIFFVMLDVYLSKQHFYYESIFYVVSAITGTGAGTVKPVVDFPHTSILIIILCMVSGAAYGSTSGGLKLWRSIIILKVIRREMLKPFLPENTVLPIKIGNNVVSDETALKAASYMLMYVLLMLMGSVVFMFFNYSFTESIFTVASAQGNVGLNIIPSAQYFYMHPFLKVLLTFHMLAGRMEIFPMLVLLRALVKR